MQLRGSFISLIFLSLALGLAGCAPALGLAQSAADPAFSVLLRPGEPVGQSFTARQSGLTGLEIYLAPADPPSDGNLSLQLRPGPQSADVLAEARLPLSLVQGPGFYRFAFPAQPHPPPYNYYFALAADGGSVHVGGAPGGAFLDGARYVGAVPTDAQMAFNLLYDPGRLLAGLARQVGRWAVWLAAAGLAFVLPGWAWLLLLGPRFSALGRIEKLSLSGSLSLALYPVLFVLTDAVNLHLGWWNVWLPVLAALAALGWRAVADYQARRAAHGVGQPLAPAGYRVRLRRWWVEAGAAWLDRAAPGAAWLVVAGLVFAARFWVIRLMDAPAWGDSVQHTAIAQLMLDNGGLFASWQPYAPYTTLTIQFGFSAAIAVLGWVTGLDGVTATLVGGQIINGLAVLALYPLAVRLAGGRRWAGVGAVLIAGLLSPMPAFYVNWGRYAQLAGQAILPAALWMVWELLEGDRLRWRVAILAGSALAGMLLTYYRMPFYYAAFIFAWLAGWGASPRGLDLRGWVQSLARLALTAAIAFGLFIPWGRRLLDSKLAGAVEIGVTTGSLLDAVVADYRNWLALGQYVPLPIAAAALLALAWALFRRQWAAASVGLWVLLLSSLVAGQLIRLPFANMMQTFAVLIALYIPAGLLGGWLLGEVMAATPRRAQQWTAAAAIVVVAGWAAWTQQQVFRPNFVMVTQPDLRAMAWIRTHTPPEARFLAQGFRIFGGTSAVGADAGWWIPFLAGRANTMPPQYAMLNEQPSPPDYTQRVVDLVAALETTPLDSAGAVRLLCEWDITHVYVGQGQGLVSAVPAQLYSPASLAANSALTRVYAQDRVQIYEVDATACQVGP